MYLNNMCGVDAWRGNQTGLNVILKHYSDLFNAEQVGFFLFDEFCVVLFIYLLKHTTCIIFYIDKNVLGYPLCESDDCVSLLIKKKLIFILFIFRFN